MKPKHPERFKRRQERMRNLDVLAKIPAALVMECEMTLADYHGGRFRAGLHMIRWGVWLWAVAHYWNVVYLLCDKIGWTKLIPLPNNLGFQRHGANCHWNCQDHDCIEKAVPKWYQKLTRWHQ